LSNYLPKSGELFDVGRLSYPQAFRADFGVPKPRFGAFFAPFLRTKIWRIKQGFEQ
jgi:hypothetical protein